MMSSMIQSPGVSLAEGHNAKAGPNPVPDPNHIPLREFKARQARLYGEPDGGSVDSAPAAAAARARRPRGRRQAGGRGGAAVDSLSAGERGRRRRRRRRVARRRRTTRCASAAGAGSGDDEARMRTGGCCTRPTGARTRRARSRTRAGCRTSRPCAARAGRLAALEEPEGPRRAHAVLLESDKKRLPVPPLGATTGHGLIHGALNKGPGSLDDEYYDDGTPPAATRAQRSRPRRQGNRSTARSAAPGDAPPGQGSKREAI